jgi:hypothetical protein
MLYFVPGNMFFRGQWEFCETYEPGDVVVRADILFLAIRQSAGEDPFVPSSGNFWKPLSGTLDSEVEVKSNKGRPGGYAPLGEDGKISLLYLPAIPLITDHNIATKRDAADCHPMEAVTGLTDALDGKVDETASSTGEWMENIEVEHDDPDSATIRVYTSKLDGSENAIEYERMIYGATPPGLDPATEPGTAGLLTASDKARLDWLPPFPLADTFQDTIISIARKMLLDMLEPTAPDGKPVLLGYDPETRTLFGCSLSDVTGVTDHIYGGTPEMALGDYPDGRLSGSDPSMALGDYPDGRLSGGGPLTV